MTKTTISVCKVYKNSGFWRFHRDKTRKHWKHYFIEDGQFCTEWVNSISARFLKTRKKKLLSSVCFDCMNQFKAYVKNYKETPECPYCDE